MKKHTLLLACAMRILLNLIALPEGGGEASRYGANIFLNLIALLLEGERQKGKGLARAKHDDFEALLIFMCCTKTT